MVQLLNLQHLIEVNYKEVEQLRVNVIPTALLHDPDQLADPNAFQ